MNEQSVHVFVPSMDGEYVPVKFTSPDKDMKETEVLIFLDEENRDIFIWTGSNSSVRKRFISSQIARQMRLERGLTHKISTEDQGNETLKFWDFIDSLKGKEIGASTLLEVSPPSISIDLPDSKPTEIITHPTTLKKVDSIKTQTPMKTKTVESSLKPSPPIVESQRIESEKMEMVYYSEEVDTAIPETRAILLFKATNQDLILTTLHISTAATEGRIAFYCIPKDGKTSNCKTKKPILAIYLQEGVPILELDDLYIPIPKGNSVYFSCPADTFIGVNVES
ncbi:MAG: hypothetical protein ACFFB2_01130 [Promethearchaeota archaeon]